MAENWLSSTWITEENVQIIFKRNYKYHVTLQPAFLFGRGVKQ